MSERDNRAAQALRAEIARRGRGGVRAIAKEFGVDAGQLSRWARAQAKPDAPGRGKLIALGIEFPWWEEAPLPVAAGTALADALTDEVTPAEAPTPKRHSSAPPPPSPVAAFPDAAFQAKSRGWYDRVQLADATDVDDETTSRDAAVDGVKVSERDRLDTEPDPRAGAVLERTPKPLTALDVEVPERVTVLDEEIERTPTPNPDGAI